MSGRFAGLKSLQQPEDEEAVTSPPEVSPPGPGRGEPPARRTDVGTASRAATAPKPDARNDAATTAPARPWEAATAPAEPVKALNGRVPRSVRLAFDRQLTDAMDTLGMDVTVDLAVEALARLVVENEDIRERWFHLLWTLKRGS